MRMPWLGAALAAALLFGLYLPQRAAATSPCYPVAYEHLALEVESVEIDGVTQDGGAEDLSLQVLDGWQVLTRLYDPDTQGSRQVLGVRR